MAKTRKFYVVWNGREPGVYGTWADCLAQVDGFAGAKYKAFASRELADEAFHSSYYDYIGKTPKTAAKKPLAAATSPEQNALAVDAACSGNPGRMEYRGVYVASGTQVLHEGPFERGTNNIGEFLAIVHGLSFLKKNNLDLPLYSDSANAIAWVKAGKCRTKLAEDDRNRTLFNWIRRAEAWISENQPIKTRILKWETEQWGEIPADFGRK